MFKVFQILVLLIFGIISAQEKKIETVFFDFDKFTLDKNQIQIALDFIKKIDTSRIESVQIYGYCDDRGNHNYNYMLSENRVATVRDLLTSNGFNKNKILIIEGRGRVLIKTDTVKDLSKIRSQNRRVDMMLVPKNSFGNGIYNSLQDNHIVGDRIYFENILFPLGSSVLTPDSVIELEKIVTILNKNKNLEFEIRGHVCCTPNYFKDAVDKASGDRKLSVNRAKAVFRYLLNRNINSLRMSYKGCGNKFPLGQGEKMDRRVEFLITKT
ncbi:OmpA family protein [Flavobacterium faecale]|uniref:OmpA family protein n=1 Tax=Flavobacterium faecale TaxID=1355330 RepID=UPI003AAF0A2B